MKIVSIKKIFNNSKKYDIEVKDNHNFYANGILVHNCTMYNDYIHARSIDSSSHLSRNWVKGLWSQISYLLDDNMRICGENVYAKHSIQYDNLESYFYMFSMWIDNTCLSWDETIEYSTILGLKTVPVIYRGTFDYNEIMKSFKSFDYPNKHEGFVIRLSDSFNYFDFKKSVAKYVSPEFKAMLNDSHGHWISKQIIPNKLKKDDN